MKDAEANNSFYSDKDKEGGNMEMMRSQDAQQIFVIEKGNKKNGRAPSRTSTNSFTNQPLSVNSTVNRSVVSLGEILKVKPQEQEAQQKPGKMQQVCHLLDGGILLIMTMQLLDTDVVAEDFGVSSGRNVATDLISQVFIALFQFVQKH